jgi:hypothetical protein
VACAVLCLAASAAPTRTSSGPCPKSRLAQADIPVAIAAKGQRTFYVRRDGGDAGQCNGRSDAPYPGKGRDRDCAWNSPEVALPASGAPRIEGGDTLLIGAGDYRIGEHGPMQPLPSGAGTTTPTRILGKPGAMPRLIGTGGVHRVLNLEGSSNIEVGRLEITDGSDCVHKHAGPKVACNEGMAWARVGIYARDSSNAWLHDLDIHGLAARGLNAGKLRNWTMERIRLVANGTAGWDGNVGKDGSDSGRMILRDVEIAWNGCGERVDSRQPYACWAQQAGGYGDGVGTTDTGGQWLVEDAYIHHNTSDGLDLRYMDGAPSTRVTLRRIHAVANAGNQVKVKGNSLIEDSVLVGHCSFFKGRDFMQEKDLCRGDGSTLQLVMTGGDTAIVRRNTLAGEGAAQIGHSEGDASDRIEIADNVVVGFPYYQGNGKPTAFNAGKAPAARHLSGNTAWDVRDCPADTQCRQPPKLARMTLAGFDASPGPGNAGARSGAIPCRVSAPDR